MDQHLILKNIAKHISLTGDETEYVLSVLKYKEVAKKSFLLKEGENCKTFSYVHSGALRTYCIDKDGKESTIMFAVADWWVTDMYCFLNRKPAMMFIQAIENSCLFQLNRDDFENLFAKLPKFEKFFRILMQNAYTREQVRVIENLTLSAEERYSSFLNRYPHIAQQITQKQIASYLGITPEFLSAIRKSKAKKIS